MNEEYSPNHLVKIINSLNGIGEERKFWLIALVKMIKVFFYSSNF
jgi:hypothetical protein